MPPYFRGRLIEDIPAKHVIRFLVWLFAGIFLCIFVAIGFAVAGFTIEAGLMNVVMPVIFLVIVCGGLVLSEVRRVVRFVVNGSGIEIEYVYSKQSKRIIQTGDIVSFALLMQYPQTQQRSRLVNVPHFTLHMATKNQGDPVVVAVRPREVMDLIGQIRNYGFVLTENAVENLREYERKLLWAKVINGGCGGIIFLLYAASFVASFWR